jgi:uncharacterized protein YegP (UPF0339 family)
MKVFKWLKDVLTPDCAGCCGAAEFPPTPTHDCEVYTDRAGEWRWRIRVVNSNIVADSGEGYKNRADLDAVWEHIVADCKADQFNVEFYHDVSGEARWRWKHKNGNIVADSGEGYKNSIDCIETFVNLAWAIQHGMCSKAKKDL